MERKQWEGRVVDGRFLLRQYLGGSPHSAVYMTDSGDGAQRKAAIKLVPADAGKADAWVLRRELAAKLSHPGLLSISHSGTCRIDDSVCACAVMEPSDEDLSQVIPTRPLTVIEARELLLAVVEILEYVHARGFVHGRLTPANLMAASDRIKISSDCLLRAGESSDDLWEPNANDPPESRGGVTPAGDVWWLGMTLVEALTQRAPAWNRAQAADPAVPESIPAPFRDIARRCLRSDPRARCSLAEISQALQPARPAPQEGPRGAAAAPVAKPAGAKKRRYLLPVAIAVLAGLAATGAIMTGLLPVGSPSGTVSHPPAELQPAAVAAPETASRASTAPEAAVPVPGEGAKTADTSKPSPVSGEVIPGDGGKTPAAAPPEPPPALAASAPASDGPNGDVVTRYVPEFPAAYLSTISGRFTVSVRVKVDQSGAVVDAALDSRPNSRYFDRVSVEAARRWKFKPAGDGTTHLVRFDYSREGCAAR